MLQNQTEMFSRNEILQSVALIAIGGIVALLVSKLLERDEEAVVRREIRGDELHKADRQPREHDERFCWGVSALVPISKIFGQGNLIVPKVLIVLKRQKSEQFCVTTEKENARCQEVTRFFIMAEFSSFNFRVYCSFVFIFIYGLFSIFSLRLLHSSQCNCYRKISPEQRGATRLIFTRWKLILTRWTKLCPLKSHVTSRVMHVRKSPWSAMRSCGFVCHAIRLR